MIFKGFVVLIWFGVLAETRSAKRQTLSSFDLGRFRRTDQLESIDPIKSDLQGGFGRPRRCLSSLLTLLWPQVFGPVDQGRIEEKSFQEIPKMGLEYRLDGIRKRAREEEEKRLAVRNYLKSMTEAQDRFYGYPAYVGGNFDSGEKFNSIKSW